MGVWSTRRIWRFDTTYWVTHSSAELNNEGRASVFRPFAVNLDVSLRFSGGADVLFENSASDVTAYKWPIYEDPIVHRDRKFKFESSDLFLLRARSQGKKSAPSPKLACAASVRDRDTKCVSEKDDCRKSWQSRLISAGLIFYTDSRSWKRVKEISGGCRTREALSFAVDISGNALFKDISLLFKARRCKNMCHRMRVVHTKARTIGRYWYMGISMNVTNAKSAGIED